MFADLYCNHHSGTGSNFNPLRPW